MSSLQGETIPILASRDISESVAFYERLGFADEAKALQEAFLAGRQSEAIAAMSDELVDAMTICGPPEHVRDRIAAYREAGTTTLIVGLVHPTLRLRQEQLRLIAELAEI